MVIVISLIIWFLIWLLLVAGRVGVGWGEIDPTEGWGPPLCRRGASPGRRRGAARLPSRGCSCCTCKCVCWPFGRKIVTLCVHVFVRMLAAPLRAHAQVHAASRHANARTHSHARTHVHARTNINTHSHAHEHARTHEN